MATASNMRRMFAAGTSSETNDLLTGYDTACSLSHRRERSDAHHAEETM